MPELKNRVSILNIRSQMNLLLTMVRFMAATLDLAQENGDARNTLAAMTQSISEQTEELNGDVSSYVSALASALAAGN